MASKFLNTTPSERRASAAHRISLKCGESEFHRNDFSPTHFISTSESLSMAPEKTTKCMGTRFEIHGFHSDETQDGLWQSANRCVADEFDIRNVVGDRFREEWRQMNRQCISISKSAAKQLLTHRISVHRISLQ